MSIKNDEHSLLLVREDSDEECGNQTSPPESGYRSDVLVVMPTLIGIL